MIIRDQGDLLERRMFSEGEFAEVFSLYPTVWALYVLPNRSPGHLGLANAEWLRFAERHYSCIVRCWMAHTALREIRSLCQSSLDAPTADHHLQLHRLLFDFFCSLGAAIDNMRFSYAAHPVNSVNDFEKAFSRTDIGTSLKCLYERRTQFIHKAIVPCFDRNGLLSLDSALFDDTETRWDQRRPLKISSVADLCDFYWDGFVTEMRSVWSRLLDILKANRPTSVAEIKFSPLQPGELQWSSASPSWPSGWPNLPGPSG